MIASGLLWYDDDAHRPLALKLAEAAQRYRERVGYEPTTCQLNPSQAPVATPSDIATDATPKRVSARRGSRKAAANLPPITLALIPDAGLRPNYFFVGVAEGEPLKRASIFRDDDTDDLQPKIPATRQRSKGATTKLANTSNGTHRAALPRTGEGLGGEVYPSGNVSGNVSGNQPTVAFQPATENSLAAPQSAQADFVAERSGAPGRGFNRPLTGNTSGNGSNNTSGNVSGKNSGNDSGKRATAPTLKPGSPAPVDTPSVTSVPAGSTPSRKKRVPAKTAMPAATISPNSTTDIEAKTRTKKTAQAAATSSHSTAAAPATATQAATTKTKTAAKTAKPASILPAPIAEAQSTAPRKTRLPTKTVKPAAIEAKPTQQPTQTRLPAKAAKPESPAATDAPRSIKAKAPAKTAILPAATPATIPAIKAAKAPATASRPAAAESVPADKTATTKTKTAAKTATTETASPKIRRSITNPAPTSETQKAAKTAKPTRATTPNAKTHAPTPATQSASPAKIPATQSAKSAKPSARAERPAKAASLLPANPTTPTSMPSVPRRGRGMSRRSTQEEPSRPAVATHPALSKTATPARTVATPPGKIRPQPEPAQADLWGEPAAVEPRRKTRRTA